MFLGGRGRGEKMNDRSHQCSGRVCIENENLINRQRASSVLCTRAPCKEKLRNFLVSLLLFTYCTQQKGLILTQSKESYASCKWSIPFSVVSKNIS